MSSKLSMYKSIGYYFQAAIYWQFIILFSVNI
jgi:hypothetical protein